MRLQNKVVIITGAGAGLGREAALLFSREGALLVASDVDGSRAEATAAAVQKQGGKAIAVKADVALESDVIGLVQQSLSEYGKLDVMFANAGVSVPGFGKIPFEETSFESYRRIVDVNLGGLFLCAKHSVAPMRANGGGAIVVTSSSSALVGFPGFALYGAAKGGVNSLVRGLALDLGQYNIRVNAICPMHGMSVNFLMDASSEVLQKSHDEASSAASDSWDPAAGGYPLHTPRPPTLSDNAYAALFLASDESACMSGVSFPTCDLGRLSRVAM